MLRIFFSQSLEAHKISSSYYLYDSVKYLCCTKLCWTMHLYNYCIHNYCNLCVLWKISLPLLFTVHALLLCFAWVYLNNLTRVPDHLSRLQVTRYFLLYVMLYTLGNTNLMQYCVILAVLTEKERGFNEKKYAELFVQNILYSVKYKQKNPIFIKYPSSLLFWILGCCWDGWTGHRTSAVFIGARVNLWSILLEQSSEDYCSNVMSAISKLDLSWWTVSAIAPCQYQIGWKWNGCWFLIWNYTLVVNHSWCFHIFAL